jgi:hypothetical protein
LRFANELAQRRGGAQTARAVLGKLAGVNVHGNSLVLMGDGQKRKNFVVAASRQSAAN